MGRHWTMIGADSPIVAEVYATTTLKNFTPSELDDTVLVVEMEAVPRSAQLLPLHSCHWWTVPLRLSVSLEPV